LRLLAELQIADGDLEETRAIHTRATARDFEQVGHDIKDKTHCRDADITEDSNGSLPAILV
jgi:hypothetical protein